MPQGFQVYDASGNLLVDVGNSLGKVLGVVTITAGVNGSVTNAGFALGDPFWQCVAQATYGTHQPAFSFNAGTNTLSWDWEGRSGVNCKLVYGVY